MTVKAGIVEDEPRSKCRFCWRSFAAKWRLSTGEVRPGDAALRSHVMSEHDHLLSDAEFYALFGCTREEMGQSSITSTRCAECFGPNDRELDPSGVCSRCAATVVEAPK